MNLMTKKNNPKNFLDEYQSEIAPKIQEIDIFLKTSEGSLSCSYISNLLYIPIEEVKAIAAQESIESFNTYNFFSIMKKGSSNICKLFRREIERGCPSIYSKEDISYIYEIDINVINDVCNKIGFEFFTNRTLPILFSNIPIEK